MVTTRPTARPVDIADVHLEVHPVTGDATRVQPADRLTGGRRRIHLAYPSKVDRAHYRRQRLHSGLGGLGGVPEAEGHHVLVPHQRATAFEVGEHV